MKMLPADFLATEDSTSIHVLLAYDHDRNRGAIIEVLDRISKRLRDKKLFHIKAFTFGRLEQTDAVKWTAQNAADAELAVVAFDESSAPGAGLLRWLDNWAQRHEGMDAALGLLPMGLHTGNSLERLVRTLRATAERHGLGFIYQPETSATPFHEAWTAVA